MEYKVINNFLEKDTFIKLKEALMSDKINWFWKPHMTTNDNYFFNHCFFSNNTVQSIFYTPLIIPILNLLNCKSVSEVRANLMLKKEKQYKSNFHVDRDYKCKTAILYMNTCNGYTLLNKKKKIKINCVENSILIFDSQIEHAGVSQTDVDRRIVINFNYF